MGSAGANWDLLRLLVVREVRVRYARAALGIAWAVFQPAIYLAVFASVGFSALIDSETSAFAEVPYASFAFCGLVFWIHFQQSVVTGTSSIALAHDILHKAKFPAELVPLSRLIAWLLDLGIGFVLLLGLMALQGRDFHATTLLVPVVFLFQLAFTAGLALLLSALNLFFRDIHYMLQAFMPVALFASNVVVPLDMAGPTAARIFALNPVVSYLDAYRHLLFLGQFPDMDSAMAGIVGAVVAPVVGLLYFRRVRPRFAEEV